MVKMHQRPSPSVEDGAALKGYPQRVSAFRWFCLRESEMTQPAIAAAKPVSEHVDRRTWPMTARAQGLNPSRRRTQAREQPWPRKGLLARFANAPWPARC